MSYVLRKLLARQVTSTFTGYIIKSRAQRKAREAVRSSSVKIRGNDVIASVKVLTALWLVPLTYIIYAICAGLYTGSFVIGFIVWLLLPFFSYLRCALRITTA